MASSTSLSRRRGHRSGAGGWLGSALFSFLAVLGCIALLLSLGLVVLFLLSNSSNSSSSRYRISGAGQKLAGVPEMLRGRVPPVPVGGSAAREQQQGQKGQDPLLRRDKEEEEEEEPLDLEAEEEEKLERHDDGIVRDDAVAVQRMEEKEEGQAKQDDDPNHPRPLLDDGEAQNKKSSPDGKNKGAAQPDGLSKDLDKARRSEYPYPLNPVSADYDPTKSWTPPGGNRYDEYKDGSSPYQITNDLRQRSDKVARTRRLHIKRAMQFAWKAYEQYAFGMDEVLPQSRRGSDNWGGQGITLVDALDTLWLMDLKEEFWRARDWVRDHLNHSKVGSVSVFETTIRDLGGLLSAYDWSGDLAFLEHATDLGKRLLKAFDGNPTGIPFGMVSLEDGGTKNLDWSGGNAIVAEAGTLQLEFRYLAKAARDPNLCQKTDRAFEILHEISRPNGLFPYYVQNMGYGGQTRPSFGNDKLTFGAMADSLYEYMLKVWIQSGKTDTMYREMYDLAMDSMHKELLQKSTPSGLTYIADKEANSGNMDHKMDHLVCFMGGLLALGAYTDPRGLQSERAQRDLKTGKALTYTCYQMYARMNTGISPEYVQFVPGQDFQIGRGAPHYLLRPEAVESFYILNFLTGDPVYREWGWEVFQSIEKYCKTSAGYGSLGNVQDTHGQPRDKMESFFLAETLKYLYLLQDPDSEVDILKKHVFNTEAHPTRIFPVLDSAVAKAS